MSALPAELTRSGVEGDFRTVIKQHEILSPEGILGQVMDFYRLKVGPDTLDDHIEIARSLGVQMDHMFVQDVLLPRLTERTENGEEETEKIHLVIPVALRAAGALIDIDPATNAFKQLEASHPESFKVTFLPIGVTRHKEATMDINFHQYYPGEELNLDDWLGDDAGYIRIVRSIDFGGASGESMVETTARVTRALGVPPENTFIDTVISTDYAMNRFKEVGNGRRLLTGLPNENFWIVGAGRNNDQVVPFDQLVPPLFPKDWGFVCIGMEDPNTMGMTREISDAEFLELYEEQSARFFEMLDKVLALNSNPAAAEHVKTIGRSQMDQWFRQRYLGHLQAA